MSMAIGVGVAISSVGGSAVEAKATTNQTVTYTISSLQWTSDNGNWTSVADLTYSTSTPKYGMNKDGTSSAISPISYSNISSFVFSGSKSTTGNGTCNLSYSSGNAVNGEWINLGSKDFSNSLTWTITSPISGYLKFAMTRTAGNIYVDSLAVTYELPTLNSIAVSETNAPENHYAGDIIRSSDLTIVPTYSDGVGSPITDGTGVYFDSEYSTTSTTLVEGSNAISVYYKDTKARTANATLNINDVNAARTVTDVLSVASAPNKVALGKTIDASNVILNVSFNVGDNGTAVATSVTCNTSTAGNVTATATYSSASGNKTATWTIEVVDGSENHPYNVETALSAAGDLNSGSSLSGTRYAIGTISEITTAYNPSYKNISFNIVDAGGNGDTLMAFRCAATSKEDYVKGDLVLISGTIINYNGTIEFNSGCTAVLNQPSSISISGGKTVYKVGESFAWDSIAKVTWTLDGLHDEAVNKSTLSFSVEEGTVFTKSDLGSKSVTVTYTNEDSRINTINGTLSLTIDYADPEGVSLDVEKAVKLSLDDSITITATVADTNKAEQVVVWTLETELDEDDDYEVVKDDNVVILEAKKTEGTIKVIASAGEYSDYTIITISADPIIVLNTHDLGSQYTGDDDYTIYVADFDNFDDIPEFVWESSDDDIATVTVDDEDNSRANIKYIDAGTATITVSAIIDEEVVATDECTVEVIKSVVTSITLDHSNESLYTGDTLTLTPTVNKNSEFATNDITWTSSDEEVVTVENGVVTAVGAGNASVTAESSYTSGVFASCSFTVTQLTMSLSWTGKSSSPTWYVGDKVSLDGGTLTAKYNDTSRGTNGSVTIDLADSGVSAFLKDARNVETPIDKDTYTFKKSDNGMKLGFVYNDGTLEAKSSAYTIKVINWREVSEEIISSAIFDFALNTTGSSNAFTTSTFEKIYSDDSGLTIPTISSITALYAGNSSGGIKTGKGFGRIGKSGSVTLTFDATVKITSVTMGLLSWDTTEHATISVTNATDYTTEANKDENNNYIFTQHTFLLSSSINSITISSDTKRAYIDKITINATGIQNVSKSSDALGLEEFIDTYLHTDIAFNDDPELEINNTGDCKTEGWYSAAKATFNGLNLHQRTLFISNSAYANEFARLSAWATANGDKFQTKSGDDLNKIVEERRLQLLIENSPSYNNGLILIISLVSVISVGGLFIIRKYKKER